ncbi:MAG: hypothetical protein HC937_01885 [Aquincola sp.]|nr:hypothetical protein [Aquincola sp.]
MGRTSGRLAPNGICPECGTPSRQRHGWRRRRIEDFPAQGQAVWIELNVCRWRCLNSDCCRRTFSDHDTAVAAPCARRTSRQAQLLGHMAHAAGGSPAERLLRRLGHPGQPTIPFSGNCCVRLKLFHQGSDAGGGRIVS